MWRLRMNNCASARVNGVVSEEKLVYFPGCKRKKKASTIILEVYCMISSLPARAMTIIRCSTEIGPGLTRRGGGSSLVYANHIRVRPKSILTIPVKHRSTPPVP